MLLFYKPNIDFISEHATDPDKRRYAIASEGARHYINIDHYGKYPYAELPHKWQDALNIFASPIFHRYRKKPFSEKDLK